ncbi:MAG: ABC transporter ATP-binding protein [Marichromatium sp.]|nr:ABC transporter ATP-binding protein [Marichromatium sp.]
MIWVDNVSKIFHEGTPKAFSALSSVSLHVKRGETLLLEGASGSGKSTLLGLMAGLYQPSLGKITIDNTAISSLPEHFSSRFRRERIGIIFQQFHLLPTLTVWENIVLPALPDKKDVSSHAWKLIEGFGLLGREHTLVSLLSGGEQQRVALIRALVRNPEIILADEPTANLDKALSMELIRHFEHLQNEGRTLVVATHDPLLLEWTKAHQKVVMAHGTVV